MFEVRRTSISLIYFSELFNNTYNTWNEVKFVSYLWAKSYAKLNINLDLSEKSFIKLSIWKPIIETFISIYVLFIQ